MKGFSDRIDGRDGNDGIQGKQYNARIQGGRIQRKDYMKEFKKRIQCLDPRKGFKERI